MVIVSRMSPERRQSVWTGWLDNDEGVIEKSCSHHGLTQGLGLRGPGETGVRTVASCEGGTPLPHWAPHTGLPRGAQHTWDRVHWDAGSASSALVETGGVTALPSWPPVTAEIHLAAGSVWGLAVVQGRGRRRGQRDAESYRASGCPPDRRGRPRERTVFSLALVSTGPNARSECGHDTSQGGHSC